MNKSLKIFLIFILFSFYCVKAQTSSIENRNDIKNVINLPPLQTVIDSVIKHNAMMRFRSQEIQAKEFNINTQRLYWTRNLGIQADTRYGTFDNFSSNVDGQSTTTYTSITTKQLNYGVGFYFKFPLFDALNRKNQVNVAKIELEEAKSMAEVQENDLRQTVIKQYQELILFQRLLDLKSQNLGNARVNMEMVEKEFRNGVIPVDEYVRLSDMTSRIESDYELAKSNFLLSKKLLEDMAGFSFSITN